MVVEKGPITTSNKSLGPSYHPAFSVSQEGNLQRIDSDHQASKGKTTVFSRRSSRESTFSPDSLAPHRDPKVEAVLYQRPKSVHDTADNFAAELEDQFGSSDEQTKLPARAHEFLYRRPTVTQETTKKDHALDLNEQPDGKGTELASKQQPLDDQRVTEPSTWADTQQHFAHEREQAHESQLELETKELKPDDKPAKKPNAFVTQFQTRLAKVQSSSVQHPASIDPSVASLQQLEAKATKQTQEGEIVDQSAQQMIITELLAKAAPELGELVVQPELESKYTSQSLSQEHAYLEIQTKIKDGARVAQNMIQILKEQGVEPQAAREKAVETVTKTLVKTLRDKKLDRFLQNAEDILTPESQEEITVMSYQDSHGNHLIETVSSDAYGFTTVDREEVVSERDVEADANRVEMATQIGSQLLEKARSGGADFIHSSLVAEHMPDEPGEAMASFIRQQLELLLDNEEQYDFFKEVLGKAGYVSNEYQVAQAARYATDVAPAVRLTRRITTEIVKPIDEARAINRGANFSPN